MWLRERVPKQIELATTELLWRDHAALDQRAGREIHLDAVLMNVVQIILAASIAACVIFLVAMMLFYQRYYVFYPSKATPAEAGFDRARIVHFKSEDGFGLQAWISPPEADLPTVLFLSGNYSDTASSFERVRVYYDAGYGLALLAYRGTPEVGGKPTERNHRIDARAFYDRLDEVMGQPIPAEDRVMHGFSLGSAVGSRLASERPFRAVILEATFAKVCSYYERRYFGIPLCYMMWRDRFSIVDWIGDIKAPLFVAHGSEDAELLLDWSKDLFRVAPEPKTFRLYEGAGHSNMPQYGLTDDAISFIETTGRTASGNGQPLP